MNQPAKLEQLMAASINNCRAEPAFFRALLDATVFVHAPIVEPPGRRQFVLFKSPDDGRYVMPMFTDKSKADWAARGNVRVVALKGRELLSQVGDTAVMINPNDARCTLYPEEIERLLRDGAVASVQAWKVEKGGEAKFYKLEQSPRALVKGLQKVLPRIRGVGIAYIAGIQWPGGNKPDSVVIVLGGDEQGAERSVRAVATALYEQMEKSERPVDVTHFDSRRLPPPWVEDLGLKPIYLRQPMKASPARRGYN
jgi:hypothetical protein